MSASEKAKQSGFESLREASAWTGIPIRTLEDWEKSKPDHFESAIRGGISKKQEAKFEGAFNEIFKEAT